MDTEDMIAIVGLDWAGGPEEGLQAFSRMAYAGTATAARGTEWPACSTTYRPEAAERILGAAVGERREAKLGAIVCATHGAEAAAHRLLVGFSREADECFALGLQRLDPIAALEIGQAWLRQRVVDLVVVASEDAASTGAVLLSRASSVPKQRIFALVENVTLGSSQQGAEVIQRGLAAAGVTPSQIGYLDVGAWPPSAEILSSYLTSTEDLTCAVGTAGALFGDPSPMAALINAALCIHRRQWVPTPAANQVAAEETGDLQKAWRGTPFHSVTDAQPWFLGQCRSEAGSDRRRAAVFHADAFGTGHVVLAEADPRRLIQPVRPELARPGRTVIPVAGGTKGQILSRLDLLRRRLVQGESLQSVASEAHLDYKRECEAAYAVAIVGRDRESALQEFQHSVGGVEAAFESGRDWLTPGGSAFTVTPLGNQGVAFVYPGAFNSYVGLGRDLFQHFPNLHEQLEVLVSDPSRAVAEYVLYPRSRHRPSEADLKAHTAALALDPPALIESGTIFAVAHTMILRDLFGVVPQAALGYSLGEASMLWAAGVWGDGDAGGARLRSTPLFRTRISGPKHAVKEYWGLGSEEKVFWASYLLKAQVDDVRRQLDEACPSGQRPHVYLTLVNQPDEVVIAGDAEGCRRVVEALGCHALPIPYEVVIHCEAIKSEWEAFADLYRHPVVDRPLMRFYSAADYDELQLDSAALADAMARMTCAPVDFPRLVDRVYAGDASGTTVRVFVELGPLATSTRRIRRILRGKPHAAVAINPGPGSDFDGVVGVLAQLLTHRVRMDLSPLYDDEDPMALALDLGDLIGCDRDEPIPSHGGADAVGTELQLDAYGTALLPHRACMAEGHRAFLDRRGEAQARASALISLQVAVGERMLGAGDRHGQIGTDAAVTRSEPMNLWGAVSGRPAFDEEALRQFAVGDVERCFGPDFSVYRGRRVPRIPNGDLMMMTRILSIDGQAGVFTGGPSLISAYDVPEDAWYYRAAAYRGLPPAVVLMETGLQPCGFLSAFLRSPLLEPKADLYFRNLDGHGRVLMDLDLRGKTVTNVVVLTSSVRGPGAILQSFTFSLSCQGQRFYEGEATFGYFRSEGLSRQTSLDGESGPGKGADRPGGHRVVRIPTRPGAPLRGLHLLRDLVAVRDGGSYGQGYVLGRGPISPEDWFFAAHFYQDAVMPGSLGVEAALQALVAYGRWRWPHVAGGAVDPVTDHAMRWRYRGQITPDERVLSVEVHVSEACETPTGITLVGDAGVWRGRRTSERRGGVRIYEIDGLAVHLGSA